MEPTEFSPRDEDVALPRPEAEPAFLAANAPRLAEARPNRDDWLRQAH